MSLCISLFSCLCRYLPFVSLRRCLSHLVWCSSSLLICLLGSLHGCRIPYSASRSVAHVHVWHTLWLALSVCVSKEVSRVSLIGLSSLSLYARVPPLSFFPSSLRLAFLLFFHCFSLCCVCVCSPVTAVSARTYAGERAGTSSGAAAARREALPVAIPKRHGHIVAFLHRSRGSVQ